MARGYPPPHCENTQVLREAITEDDTMERKNFSEHHYKQLRYLVYWCTAILEMPLFFLSLEPGLGTYIYQGTMYRSVLVSFRRRLRRAAPCGSPGMANQVRQACSRRTGVGSFLSF